MTTPPDINKAIIKTGKYWNVTTRTMWGESTQVFHRKWQAIGYVQSKIDDDAIIEKYTGILCLRGKGY